jgi:hypothetical protein
MVPDLFIQIRATASAKLPQEFLLRLMKKRGLEQLNSSYVSWRLGMFPAERVSERLTNRRTRLRN